LGLFSLVYKLVVTLFISTTITSTSTTTTIKNYYYFKSLKKIKHSNIILFSGLHNYNVMYNDMYKTFKLFLNDIVITSLRNFKKEKMFMFN